MILVKSLITPMANQHPLQGAFLLERNKEGEIMARGRPKKDKYKIKNMIASVEKYTQEHIQGVPILKECCFLNNWDYDYVMKLQRNNTELRQSIKRLLDLKEALDKIIKCGTQ